MEFISTEQSDAVFKQFGYANQCDAITTLRRSIHGSFRFISPLRSMRQAALSESMIGGILSPGKDVYETSVIVSLLDWPIYYAYELQMFWKILDCDIVPGQRPEFSAIYWPRVDARDVNRIKAAFFVMMAFEFTGVILINDPNASILVDDGEIVCSSTAGDVRGDMLVAKQTYSGDM
jgi:hypothetical protein